MSKKVILVCIDGMRPDGLMQCGNPLVEELMKKASYTLDAQTVMPSCTLPCHMSMFHSVPPTRHGILSNQYVPQVRPIDGLFEVAKRAGKHTAMFYGWEPLRDIARPLSMVTGAFRCARAADDTDTWLTDQALKAIKEDQPDFIFLYMVETDEKGGHDHGWMTPEYLNYISVALDNVRRVLDVIDDSYSLIITADHGGHDQTHGTELPEDMTIPMVFYGSEFAAGQELHDISILDLAPTIADILELQKPREWEGKSLIAK